MSDIAKVHDIQWYSEVPRSIWKQTLIGLLLMALFLGGFGTWALTAPLAAAVIAQGSFVATGRNKIVQHLEGGVIRELLVKEGDRVVEGQPLVILDETAARAKSRELFLRRVLLEATAARLTVQSEQGGRYVPPPLVAGHRNDSEVNSILRSQELNFKAQQVKLSGELSLLVQNMEALRFRAKGYSRQRDAYLQQLNLLKAEHESKKLLQKKGVIRANDVRTLERAMADATGQIGRLEAEVAETEAQIVKTKQEMERAHQLYRQDALDRLQDIQSERDMVREQLTQAENVLERATIHSPVTGVVVRTHYNTTGGVIESGKGILEILPSGVPLIIEVQIPRTSIDRVRAGQTATVRLISLNQRTTPVLNGKVIYVSADALQDAREASQDVYVARVDVPSQELARVHGFSPTPGMPAEVMVQTESRTFFNYLAKPITDSMSRAFTER
ncbi:Type I secretion membrane fusion protein, HlyD family [Pseudorhizobium banfieldiae]|uniref:Membrane fusion protein (MFP) family protein n=2 Tax=Pseudorhizobium TaxID=1903858 RepID=L0NIV1_9HYPH|nr:MULTISPECIES: HlyD family type I secretion periplasmic adaptor subunit [Pseudorhizobium]CAD6596820.1 HlyD family type I secretion periplasmic adaptor subunit [Rhizobium sp. TCK]CAD6618409.1 HlyD family type I secretion periplasmic adaptor subunit [arsenite-oxidising bacterium NT-25]CAD7052211.1 HlyD family type I secretion periplasmic adaptor subunit [Pseudorhizobium halotolerans]CCF21038.1 Type I secretion membrane fusion protein, HlyD family [Pseudorhizobium banfieldiae]